MFYFKHEGISAACQFAAYVFSLLRSVYYYLSTVLFSREEVLICVGTPDGSGFFSNSKDITNNELIRQTRIILHFSDLPAAIAWRDTNM